MFGEPRRLFVCTPSKLSAYTDCPRRYRFSYVDRPRPVKGPPWAHNSLGASVHNALRSWFDLPPGRRIPEAAATLLKAGWITDGYRDAAQQRLAFRTALDWLESYVARLDPAAEPVGVERTVATTTATLSVQGRADRIDERVGPDGRPEVVVVDYKTGRTGLDADDARGSQALALYAVAASRTFRKPCRRVELHHLPTATIAAHEHTVESLERQVRRAEQTAADIVAAERSVAGGDDPDQVFPPSPGSLCGWCDYRRHCPEGSATPGQEPWAAVERALTGPGSG
ncbi:PD-(D/E)XK nuclease family protein [Pilimelia columellifera]|uniref:RecB family exonuclease n=1 Tax=Pilimelia columellifera TaxID=706574 RepID=UPI0031DD12F3